MDKDYLILKRASTSRSSGERAAGVMGHVSFWSKADIDRRPDLIGFDAFDPKWTDAGLKSRIAAGSSSAFSLPRSTSIGWSAIWEPLFTSQSTSTNLSRRTSVLSMGHSNI